jgi:tRNA (guanine37-N1)-methyltransferase
MQVDLITLFPEMFSALDYGIVGRAQQQQQLELTYYPIRAYSGRADGRVDDRPYGGGPGMVMAYPPLVDAIEAAKQAEHRPKTQVVYLSPQGEPLTHARVVALSKLPRVTLLCGRYEGVDERVITHHVDAECSIGDYTLSGGELPAMVLIDAMVRQLPGVLGHPESAKHDSFVDGFLDHPHYTRPPEIDGHRVPDVLMEGNHEAIVRWRRKESIGKTWQKRSDLLKRLVLDESAEDLLELYKKEYRNNQ